MLSLAELCEEPATHVAPRVLGGLLSVDGVVLRITEVEAYLGVGEDPGSHAFRRKGPKNATMFGDPGRLYSYLTYGMHVCANIVCSPHGSASAVLLRAGEVIEGVAIARERRITATRDRDLARGPARLTKALGITLLDDGVDLESGRVHLELPAAASPFRTSLRTGVSGPGGIEPYAWRFFIPDEPSVLPYKAHPKRGI
jgi:DNA-3-methyladenine glycosylase